MPSIVESLSKFLNLEKERGFKNTAIIGGLHKVVPYWENEARNQSIPPEMIQSVTDLLEEYSSAEGGRRQDIIQELNIVIDGIPLPPPQENRPQLKKRPVPPSCSNQPRLHLKPDERQTGNSPENPGTGKLYLTYLLQFQPNPIQADNSATGHFQQGNPHRVESPLAPVCPIR